VRADILLTCGKHLHDHKMLLIRVYWTNKTRLTQSCFIDVSVPI